MRYLLNSAVITAEGTFEYRKIGQAAAMAWYSEIGAESTIGYAETAAVLAELLGAPVEVNRKTVQMAAGDEALVFRLVLPPGAARINPADKGGLGEILRSGAVELGLLTRIK